MTYGFKIVEEMISGLSGWMDEKGYRTVEDFRGIGRPQRHELAVPEPEPHHQGAHRPGSLHQVRALPHRLRGHVAPGDRRRAVDGRRMFVVKDEECVGCNLCVEVCPVQDCITMVPLADGEIDKRTGTG